MSHSFEKVTDAAERVGVSPRTIWRLLADGQLHRHKVRGRTVVDSEELDELVRTGSFSRGAAA